MGDMTVDELKDKNLWFLWSAKPGKNGKVTKVPFAANGGATGLEKVPMFLSTDKETVRQNSRMYLSEIISNYYRLYSKEPMSQNATDSIEIHCPLCGAVLKQMAQNHDANKLGLYTCDKCRR